jgi:hypothetical protein
MTSGGRFPQRLRSMPLRSSRTHQPPPPLEIKAIPRITFSSRRRPAHGLVSPFIGRIFVERNRRLNPWALQNWNGRRLTSARIC